MKYSYEEHRKDILKGTATLIFYLGANTFVWWVFQLEEDSENFHLAIKLGTPIIAVSFLGIYYAVKIMFRTIVDFYKGSVRYHRFNFPILTTLLLLLCSICITTNVVLIRFISLDGFLLLLLNL